MCVCVHASYQRHMFFCVAWDLGLLNVSVSVRVCARANKRLCLSRKPVDFLGACPRACVCARVRWCPLTVGEVGGRVAVVEEEAGGLGHLQVHHVWGVLQRCHRLLVAHLLQAGTVHLDTHTQAHKHKDTHTHRHTNTNTHRHTNVHTQANTSA